MQAVSDAFLAALRTHHTATATCEVLDTNGTTLATLAVHAGSVTVDQRRAIQRSTSGLAVADPTGELTPTDAADLLSPFAGNRVRLWRGIALPAGDELVLLGTFTITDATVDRGPDGVTIDLDCADLAYLLAASTLDAPYITGSGEAADAARNLLLSRYTSVDLDITSTDTAAQPVVLDVGADPWAAARKIMAAAGHVLYADTEGTIRNQPIPDPDGATPVVTYGQGQADSPYFGSQRPYSQRDAYTGVTVVGENSNLTTPVLATVWDTDPQSPTYYLGPLGRRPKVVNDALVGSNAQAEARATAELRQLIGYGDALELKILPNPAHEPFDVIGVDVPEFTGTLLLDSFTVPLQATDLMQATARTFLEVSE